MVYKRRNPYRKRYSLPAKRRRVATKITRRRAFRGKRRRFSRIRRRTYTGGRVQLMKTNNIIPPKRYFTSRYRATVVTPYDATGRIGPTVYGLSTRAYIRVTSIYDPNYAALGTFNQKATFHDFFSQLYNYYRVLSARVVFTLRFQPNVIDNPDAVNSRMVYKWGVAMDGDGTNSLIGAPWTTAAQSPNSRYKTFYVDPGRPNRQKITVNYIAKKNTSSNLSTRTALFGSDPVENTYLCPWIAGASETDSLDNTNWSMDIHCTFKVVAEEMKDFATGTVALAMHQQ